MSAVCCVCARVRVYVHACVRACVRVYVRVSVRVYACIRTCTCPTNQTRPCISGTYLTVSKEGVLAFWNNNLRKCVVHQAYNPQKVALWITAVAVLYESRVVVIATSGCDLTFYYNGLKKFEKLCRVTQFPGAILVMSYYCDAQRPIGQPAYLSCGDEEGGVTIISFHKCASKTELGVRPSAHLKKALTGEKLYLLTDLTHNGLSGISAKWVELCRCSGFLLVWKIRKDGEL